MPLNTRIELVAGIASVEEVEPVATAGAEMLYCGVFDPSWALRFPGVALGINRRPYYRECNLSSLSEAAEAAAIAHRVGARIALTLNEHFYCDAQEPLLRSIVSEAAVAGVDALIVSDGGVIALLKDMGWPGELHISTTASVYNAAAARHFFGQGACRIVFPRHLDAEEMSRIIAGAPGVYEAFVMNSGCFYDDGICGFEHALQFFSDVGAGGCALSWSLSGGVRGGYGCIPSGRPLACGACAIPALKRAGIRGLKIASREFRVAKKVRDVLFLRRLVDLSALEEGEAFSCHARELYRSLYGGSCTPSQCYYGTSRDGESSLGGSGGV